MDKLGCTLAIENKFSWHSVCTSIKKWFCLIFIQNLISRPLGRLKKRVEFCNSLYSELFSVNTLAESSGREVTVVLEDAVVHFGQVSVYDEQGNIIDQYANPDMANTESIIPAGSPIETVAEAAKVIYEIKTNPE